MKPKYYYLRGDEQSPSGIAEAEHGVRWTSIPEPCSGWISDWSPIRFRIRPNKFRSGEVSFGDHMSNNVCGGQGLLSFRVRAAIDDNRGSEDTIQWLPTLVTSHDGAEQREYYILYFPTAPDILVPSASRYVETPPDRSLFLPVFSKQRLARHEVCTFLGASGVRPPIVSERVRQAIAAAKCTGIEFQSVQVVSTVDDDRIMFPQSGVS